MPTALRRHWLLALGLASLVALVVAVNPVELSTAVRDVSRVPLALMLPVTVAGYVARALGWRVALRHIGVPIGVTRAVDVMVAGQVLIFLPTGDLGRVALVLRTGAGGRGPGEVAGTITFQELAYMALMGVATVPVVAFHPAYAGAVVALAGLLALILVLLMWEPAFTRALSLAEHIPLVRRFDVDVRDLRTGFMRTCEPATATRVAAYGMLAAVLSFVLFELSLRAVGVTDLGYADAVFIFAMGHILAAVSLLPGGLGAYEGVLTGFMALHGVPPAMGAAAALLYRGFNDVAMAVLGVGAGWHLSRRWPPGAQEVA